MSDQQNRSRPRTVVREEDGGRFFYISRGKKKSMLTDQFQRDNYFGKEDYQEVMNAIFDYVGSLSDLSARVYPQYDKSGNFVPADADKIARVRSLLGNLLSLGLVRCLTADGDDNGLYYTLTEDGMHSYIDFLVEKLPTLYKEAVLKFVKVEEDYLLPSLFLSMYLATKRNIDPMLLSLYNEDNEPTPAKDAFESFIEFDIKVNNMSEKKSREEGYLDGIKKRVKEIVDGGILEIKKRENKNYLQLTERGLGVITPVINDISDFVYRLEELPIIGVERGKNGSVDRFYLTNIGISIREAYRVLKGKKIENAEQRGNITNPPMPIRETKDDKIVFKLRETTSKSYWRYFWIRFVDVAKDQTATTWALLVFIFFVFFATVFFVFNLVSLGIFFVVSAVITVIVTLVVLAYTEFKMPKMK